MRRTQEAHRRIQNELTQERATALGRAGERLELALAHAAAVGRRFEASRDPEECLRLGRDYDAACARAREARLALVIQREAVGLRHHRVVDQQFPEPPRRGGPHRAS